MKSAKEFFGRIESRPSTYIRRDTLVTEVKPCVKIAKISMVVKIAPSVAPPTIFINSNPAESILLNVRLG